MSGHSRTDPVYAHADRSAAIEASTTSTAPAAGVYVEYELPELATTGNPDRDWESGTVEVRIEGGL